MASPKGLGRGKTDFYKRIMSINIPFKTSIIMKNFMDENFLLQTETAQELYHNHAAKMPIIDYHCHLIPQMVADDHKFKSLTEIWLGGDHYKWRAMRTNGVYERYCTGKDTTD